MGRVVTRSPSPSSLCLLHLLQALTYRGTASLKPSQMSPPFSHHILGVEPLNGQSRPLEECTIKTFQAVACLVKQHKGTW